MKRVIKKMGWTKYEFKENSIILFIFKLVVRLFNFLKHACCWWKLMYYPTLVMTTFKFFVNSNCLGKFSNIVVFNGLESISTKVVSNTIYCECWVVI
jgi:hypothetical protein